MKRERWFSMFEYDVLTRSYVNWHLKKLSMHHQRRYIHGLNLIVHQLDENEKQLGSFYEKLLNLTPNQDNHSLREIMNDLNRLRFKWSGTKSYWYCLADELILHIVSMFPHKKEQLRLILQSIELSSEQINYLLDDSFHADSNINQSYWQLKKRKQLNFWLIPYESESSHLGTTLILGTMSAGKSTILNNVLGENWAKTQNQVTTNFSLQYKHSPTLAQEFISDNDHRILSSTLNTASWLEELNESEHEGGRQLTLWSGRSTKALMNYQYTVVDTPGTNSSWKANHYKVTEQTLIHFTYDKVIVVLDATQLGTDDEKVLLSLVKEYIENRPVLFVLNKIDELDTELGETHEYYIQAAKEFLEENGFLNPEIIGTSAIATRLLNQDFHLLTKREQRMRSYFETYFGIDANTNQTVINERTGFTQILNFMKSE